MKDGFWRVLVTYFAFWAVALGLSVVVGYWWGIALALVLLLAWLLLDIARRGPKDGELFCFIWRRGHKVWHWHWPPKDVVNCERTKEGE